jgi:DNA-directed RNA polymerase subunit omega
LELALNAELTKKALEKVGNPNVLVNLISRRVRQLNSGSGGLSRPLLADTGNLGAADIALMEIIEDKVGFEMPEFVELVRPSSKRRKKH